MMTRELLELALLDAHGVLDTEESSDFERSLRSAPEGIRAQVRLEQDRIMRSELSRLRGELEGSEPDADLRERVLAAVRTAIAAREAAPEGVLGRVDASTSPQPTAAEDTAPAIRHRRRGIRPVAVWRAAALAFAASSVVFGWSTFQMRTEYERLSQAQADDAMFEALASEVGRQFVVDALVDPDTERHFLRQVADTGRPARAEASVWVNPDWDSARFFAVSLPPSKPGTTYRLALLDDQGNPIQDVLRFEFAGQLVNREVKLDITIENPVLGVVGQGEDGTDEVLMITDSAGSGA